MSEIESTINAVSESGPLIGVGVGLALAAKRLFGPTADVVAEELAERTRDSFRRRNAQRIVEKAEPLASGAGLAPHPRTVVKVLDNATLYDDDVMQSYVAGLLAGSRNSDGSDDRPIYYLNLIDALTARQMQLFHALYTAVVQTAKREKLRSETPAMLRFALKCDELEEQLQAAFGSTHEDPAKNSAPFFALMQQGLIKGFAAHEYEDGDQLIAFYMTPTGIILYDWAYGIEDENIQKFLHRERPEINLPSLTFKTGRFRETVLSDLESLL